VEEAPREESVDAAVLEVVDTPVLVSDEQGVVYANAAARTLMRGDVVGAPAISGAPVFDLADVDAGGDLPDVLLTDVVLPGMSGPELAALLRERLPELRVVLMSGYTAGLVAQGPAVAGAVLLEKPFRELTLLAALRDALDGTPPG
jgi:FixJ family two-component response regulator